jgi:cob(I)alamin adenosyltransferase
MLEKGYVQLYTGNGKGKTTAALGLALRASGAGLSVLILQFMKGMEYSELASLALLKNVHLERFGSDSFCRVGDENFETHRKLARRGYTCALEAVRSSSHDIIILDEIITAMHFKLISEEEIIDLLRAKEAHMEIVLTGRGATQRLIDASDLVTEMKEIKHYYQQGVLARKGIES